MLPTPEPGLVISCAYLWRHEREAGLEEGLKNRPCVIVLAVENQASDIRVTLAPITHRAPESSRPQIEIPPRVKTHLGLDSERSWVILDEVNQFIWPGYDLRPIAGTKDVYSYGFLPPRLFTRIKHGILDVICKERGVIITRD